jgi:predicted nucleotidyltransferase
VGTFTDIAAGLPGVDNSSVAWGDYDNDGDLDILMTGYSTVYGYISRVYENEGGTFTDTGAGLTGVYAGSVAWGDYDNDGDLDILMTGHTGTERISRVYENEGGTFTDIAAGLTGVYRSSVAWGDYDNDGDLDILMTGRTFELEPISRVYENEGGTFTDTGAGLTGVYLGSLAWGDYDNDGDLDILMTGYTGSGYISRVYENEGGTFTDIGAGLPGVWYSSVAWGDYDNDGDLDILMTGYNTGSGYISRVYKSDGATANTAPDPPSNLSLSLVGNVGTFSWDAATDAETPSAGLTYNLRIGTTPGGDEICAGMADGSSGYRRVVQLGNTNYNTTWATALPDPLPPWAYWSVQAVDSAFEGSPFAVTDTVLLGATGVSDPADDALLLTFRLHPASPNPFNPRTVIHYDLPTEVPVRVSIYDAAGRRVVTLVDDPAHAPGRHEAIWDGRSASGQSVASGVYFCRMESGDFREIRKMALIR